MTKLSDAADGAADEGRLAGGVTFNDVRWEVFF